MKIKIENIFIRADAVTSIYIMPAETRRSLFFFFLFYNGFSEAKSNYRQAALFFWGYLTSSPAQGYFYKKTFFFKKKKKSFKLLHKCIAASAYISFPFLFGGVKLIAEYGYRIRQPTLFFHASILLASFFYFHFFQNK